MGICSTSADTLILFNTQLIKQNIKFGRFLGARLAYYNNSSSTFQSRLLIAGDIEPNPGPTNPIDEHRLWDVRSYRAILFPNHEGGIITFQIGKNN